MIRELEELSLNAWPASQTVVLDGWILRFARGYTRRANSINPLYPGRCDPAEKIAACEQLYRAEGLAVTFKLTRAVEPPDLEERLERLGYRLDAPTSVQTLDLSSWEASQDTPIEFSPVLTDAWLASYIRLASIAGPNQPVLRQILEAIRLPHWFAAARAGDEVVACGMAVVQSGWVGLFDIVTAAAWRRRGYGRQVVAGLLGLGKAHGASQAYLQVMLNNSPALSLYASLGFKESYQYWYRLKS